MAEQAFINPAGATNRMDFAYLENQVFDDTDVSGNTITLPHVSTYFTASPVVYHASAAVGSTPGSIAGLTDGQVYYVVVVPSSSNVQLATTPANALAGAVITLGAVVAGTGTWTFNLVG
jgi:hypothetical protein